MPRPNDMTMSGRPLVPRTPKAFIQMVVVLQRLRASMLLDSRLPPKQVKQAFECIDTLATILSKFAESVPMSEEEREEAEKRSEAVSRGHASRSNEAD